MFGEKEGIRDMLLAYILLASSALIIIYQDIRKQTFSLWALVVFALAAFLNQGYEPDLEGLWAGGIIALLMGICQSVFYKLKHVPAMGIGDLILSPLCGLWIHLYELPVFFVVTGFVALFLGLFWRYYWRMRTYPLVPAILTSLGCVFLIRCFLSKNGL